MAKKLEEGDFITEETLKANEWEFVEDASSNQQIWKRGTERLLWHKIEQVIIELY